MPVILLPQCPHIILSDNKYSTLALPRDGAAAYLANTFCASAKKFVVDELRHTAVNLFAVIDVLAQIAAIAEYAVKTAFVPQAALRCFYAAFVQKADNVGIRSAADKHFKYSFDKWRGFLVDDKILLFVHLITEGNAPSKIFAFRRGYGNSAFYFLRKFGGIIFRHTLQNALD